MSTKFYRCATCGNVIVKMVDSSVPVVCCGKPMEELIPQVQENGMEKHLPVVTRLDELTIKVEVGSTEHPMLPAHFIQFIYVETARGGQFVQLHPEEKPAATFKTDDPIIAVYEYCNLHGLWKCEMKEA